jgi:glucosamine-6-phosphate deaminase
MLRAKQRQAHWTDFAARSTIRVMRSPQRSEVRELTGLPLPVFVAPSAQDVACALAQELLDVANTTLSAGRAPKLGFATGRTPQALYREFARRVLDEGVDLKALETFHLDEYLDLDRAHPASFREQMQAMLYRHIDHPRDRAHFPVECDQRDGLDAACASYEARLASDGGLDWQLLGIGLNGHVAFNEPGAEADSRTRVVTLSESTRLANSGDFESLDVVPRRAVTMGIATIMGARRLRIVALGPGKSAIVHELVHARMGAHLPATWLRAHPGCELWCDAAAAAEL